MKKNEHFAAIEAYGMLYQSQPIPVGGLLVAVDASNASSIKQSPLKNWMASSHIEIVL